MQEKNRLSVQDLRSLCDASVFKFKTTEDLEPLKEVIGQERAVQAIDFGLNMEGHGYNIFVTGTEGTGKLTIVQDIVQTHSLSFPTPDDWCMVNNFKDEFRPRPLRIPSGSARQFSKEMARMIKDLQKRLPKKFEDPSFQEKLTDIQSQAEGRKKQLIDQLNQYAGEKGLLITRTEMGYQPIAMKDGKPMEHEEYEKLSGDAQKSYENAAMEIVPELDKVQQEINKLNLSRNRNMEDLIEQMAQFVVKGRIDQIRPDYKNIHEIQTYLNQVQEHIIEEVDIFISPEDETGEKEPAMIEIIKGAFDVYKVNILADRRQTKGAPVVFEPNPSYKNLFGQIEKKSNMSGLSTDFTMIKGGSLLEANGGYLIMEVESILSNSAIWEALKRTLQNKQLHIEDAPSESGMIPVSLRPGPIPLDIKVILIGSYSTFEILQNHDPKFNKIFKVRADFDSETERNSRSVQLYARFIARVCNENNLLPFTPNGVASIVEFSEKFVANKHKLSLRFGPIVGIIKEAHYWAQKDNQDQISRKYVIKAFNEHRFRYNLYEEKVHESYVDESILMDVENDIVGQVNALAVYQVGDISFGRPSRITAETYMGKHGIINIERESDLSGSSHNKGILIISGYLGSTFAQKYPLNLSISVTFEQNYSGVDGDSASSTELYAILSSLSGIPIKQGIAVTGSVNQKGEVQAIGGVNQKIEGFFEVCKINGLNGKQGVIVPHSNVRNLMLKREVLDAVEKKMFHIYQVKQITEGIEILTGIPAGRSNRQGNYPKTSIFGKVQKKLELYLNRDLKLKAESRSSS